MNICSQTICIFLVFSFQMQYSFGTVWRDISQFFEKLGNDVKCLTGSCQKNEEFKLPVLRQLPDPDDVATAMPPAIACIPVTARPPPPKCIKTTTEKPKAVVLYVTGHEGSTQFTYPGFGNTPIPQDDDDCNNECGTDHKSSAMGAAPTSESSTDDCAPDDSSNAAMGSANHIEDCITYDNSNTAMGSADAAFKSSTSEPKDDCGTGMGAAYSSPTLVTDKDDCAPEMGAANISPTLDTDKDDCATGMGAANNSPTLDTDQDDCATGMGAANKSPTLETYKDDCTPDTNSNAGMGAADSVLDTGTYNCNTYNQREPAMGAANTNNVNDCNRGAMGAAKIESYAPAAVTFICNCTLLCNKNVGALGTANTNGCNKGKNTAMGASNLDKKKIKKCKNRNKLGAAIKAVKANCNANCKQVIDTSPEIVDSHEGLNIIQANGVVARKLFNGRLVLR